MNKEVEVFGVTYDRYVLLQLHRLMAGRLGLKRIVEMPSHGAKAAGSLYSLGFGQAGCQVTLVNPEMEMLPAWRDLGMADRVEAVERVDVYRTGFDDDVFDLCWNFVTWTELDDPPAYLREMARISNRYVMLVTCNNLQPGYPWHRLLHEWYGFPWTHGRNEYNYIHRVLRLFRRTGLKVVEYGAIDTPGWPDPSGPRDVRLHRRYGSAGHNRYRQKPEWKVPLLDYVKKNKFPGWMTALGKWDMTFRKGIFKLPLSHLFYIIGKK